MTKMLLIKVCYENENSYLSVLVKECSYSFFFKLLKDSEWYLAVADEFFLL